MATAAAVVRPAAQEPLAIEGGGAVRRVARLSLGAALFLSALKLGGWWISGSVGLLASLADSGLDVLAAAGTLTAVRMAASPPDAEHRFGHGKAEAFASLLQAALIFTSAALIGREAVTRLIQPVAVRAEGSAMAVMAVSTVLAALLVAAQTRVLKAARSTAVEGDRAHYLADVGSNIAALLGIAASLWLHAPRADALAGLVVTAWLVWGAFGALRHSADSLMDHELGEDERAAIRALVLRDPQVLDLHDLRTRASGPIVHIQGHVGLDPAMTIEAAHHLLVKAEARILERFPAADILLHPDPEGRAEPHGGAFAEAVREGGAFEPTGDAAPDRG